MLEVKGQDDINNSIIESVELLGKNISQVIFELNNINERKWPQAEKDLVDRSTIQPRDILEGSYDSMSLEQNLNKLSPQNDPLLNMILNKLQTSLLDVIKTTESHSKIAKDSSVNEGKEQKIAQYIEQFKNEIIWYEKKKFSQYDIDLVTLTKENALLHRHIEELQDRWNNLVESARKKKREQR